MRSTTYSSLIRRITTRVAVLACSILVAACVTQSQSFWDTDRIAELRTLISDGNLDQADFMIDRYDGTLTNNTALDISIREGNLSAVKHFIPNSQVNEPLDADGSTPLIRAVRTAPGDSREQIIRSLLAAGADPEVNDNFGRNAASYASIEGDWSLADFLESQGSSYYSSQPARRTAWLPEIAVDQVATSASKKKKTRNPVLAKSPLSRSRAGRPDLLFASTWIPQLTGPQDGPYAGLRFHADGTGDVMQFFPQDQRIEPGESSHMAWDFHRDNLYFMVLTDRFASYCKSVAGAPGRFGVQCTDYAAAGGNIAAALDTDLSSASAKVLLNDASARSRLQEVGKTNSVLKPAASNVCRPDRAARKVREGKPKSAASRKAPGDWVVFDAKRFSTYSSESELVCTQREARKAAFKICKAAGGNCRSVGGCRKGQATVVASVQGHDWAWVGCDADVEFAKLQALQKCQEKAGCDCQVVYASAKAPVGPKEVCRAGG